MSSESADKVLPEEGLELKDSKDSTEQVVTLEEDGQEKEKKTKAKEETVTKKEDELTITDEEKLTGGLKVFRRALNVFAKNQDQDVTEYHVMEQCKKLSCYVGIDEAGRGPVLGPMVYSIFACVADEEEINSKKGKRQTLAKIEECPPTLLDKNKEVSKLNDSKQLTEKVREEILKKFSDLDYIAFGIKIISPSQIANKSFRRQKYSLNEVSHNAAIELIQGLADRGVVISKVYVDTVGPMDVYQKKLENTFPDIRFKVDKKADSKYKPVSAASICAKVTRDVALREWNFPANENIYLEKAGWGSGYPGDAVTKRFLRKNIDPVFGFPNIVRNSWSTASDLVEKCAVKVKWETDEPDGASTQKISKFFVKSEKTSTANDENEPLATEMAKKKSQFFSYRNLEQTSSIF